jgi:anti-sigma B factor antagonist
MSTPHAARSLTLEVEHKEAFALVHCRGHLVSGLCDHLHGKVHPLIPHHKRIVLDLTELVFVDSMGMGTLVRLYVSAKSGGSCIELINLGTQVRKMLGITHLLGLFGDMCEKGVAVKF